MTDLLVIVQAEDAAERLLADARAERERLLKEAAAHREERLAAVRPPNLPAPRVRAQATDTTALRRKAKKNMRAAVARIVEGVRALA